MYLLMMLTVDNNSGAIAYGTAFNGLDGGHINLLTHAGPSNVGKWTSRTLESARVMEWRR